jgi:hypothetical protein
MTVRKVTALPTWLLNRCVSGNRREALLGDLFEEYQAGRTPGWYWRETLVALFVSIRRHARRLFSYGGTQSILALTAQALLFVWFVTLSEQYRQHCTTAPDLLSGPIIPILCAGVVLIAIAVVVWLSPLGLHVRMNTRSGLVRLSVAVFAAIGLSGGALTWASTASCSRSPSACSSSSVVKTCERRGEESPRGRPSTAHSAHLP